MSFKMPDLVSLLDLEPIEHNIYRGQNRDIGTGRIYGGQVLAQALVAAQRTVDEGRHVHSMHGYFILEGDLDLPVVYFVDRLRDGGSFSTRRVTAIQHGRAIFNLSASFHDPEPGLDHQSEMPAVPSPEALTPEVELLRAQADRIPLEIRAIATQDRPLDIRLIDEPDPFDTTPGSPSRRLWIRAVERLADDPLHHQAVLAYASDYGLLVTSLRPHGMTYRDPRMMVASLDHSIWFHRPFRADEWLLYVVDSPSAGQGRGFTRGSYFSEDGTLIASTAQEGLIRVRRPR